MCMCVHCVIMIVEKCWCPDHDTKHYPVLNVIAYNHCVSVLHFQNFKCWVSELYMCTTKLYFCVVHFLVVYKLLLDYFSGHGYDDSCNYWHYVDTCTIPLTFSVSCWYLIPSKKLKFIYSASSVIRTPLVWRLCQGVQISE